MSSSLLPTSATPWERALADGMAVSELVGSAITAMRRVKYVSPRPSMLPFLVWEYGLGELTPYVPNLYDLIDQGVRWQRLRGTVSAIAIGLGWIGYTAKLEEAWTGRRWWNSFQLRFDTLPAKDLPDLERIEGITSLSVPKRSMLRRGVFAYDVGAVALDDTLLDGALLEDESGVAVTQAGTLWSFGRTYEHEHTLTEAEGLAIGNWLDPVSDEGLLWANLDIPWVEADFLWADDPVMQRRAILAGWFVGKPLYLRLSSAAGVIGYRLCRAVRAVRQQFGGAYSFAGSAYEPSAAAGNLYVEAMTDFGDANDVTCIEAALMVGAERAPGVKPGKAWLRPSELTAGTAIAAWPVSIPLRTTVRERFKLMMRF
ncbi:phage tail protein [Paradevosia shaoguanensis]|nr:phage tail protein [Paradevosia shaoguanensis]